METKDTKVIYCNEAMSEMAEFIQRMSTVLDWFDLLYYTSRWQQVQDSLDNDDPEIWGEAFYSFRHEISKLKEAILSFKEEDLPRIIDESKQDCSHGCPF